MSDLELVLTMLAESSTTDIAKAEQPQGFDENQRSPAAAAMSRVWQEKRWKPKLASLSLPRRTPRASANSSRT